MRLIDADALDWERIEHEHGARHEAVVDCEQMVEIAPTIDAVPATLADTLCYLHEVGWMQEHDRIMTEDAGPVRHGRWDRQKDKQVCSLCGAEWYYFENDVDMFGYCPKCGAKMDEEVD